MTAVVANYNLRIRSSDLPVAPPEEQMDWDDYDHDVVQDAASEGASDFMEEDEDE